MMRTIALVLAWSACASQARRVQANADNGINLQDSISQSLQMLRDPDAMAQITEMMRDPRVQDEMRQAIATNPMVSGLPRNAMDPEVLAQQMEKMMQDPEFMAKAKQAADQMEQLLQDPAFMEQANLIAEQISEQMMAGARPQRRNNALASLLLALNPAAPHSVAASAFARSPARQLKMEEPTDKAVTIGAAAVGGLLGVWLTGEVTSAAALAAAAAYASTLDNSVGGAVKKVGTLSAKAYDKTTELNEQYDVVSKAKGAADTVVNVADNLNKNYGLTDKIDEKLKLGATVDKVTDKFDELKDSVTKNVDDLKKNAEK